MERCSLSPRPLFPGGFFYAGDVVTADSLLLASFVTGSPRRGIDLGCGSGLLTLSLLWVFPELSMEAVELRSDALSELSENLSRNGWARRCRLHEGDLRSVPPETGCFDLVITNPPYFAAGRGRSSPDAKRRLMREETASLSELCRAAARLLTADGRFYLVHLFSRRHELHEAIRDAGLFPIRERFFAPRPGCDPSILFLEAGKTAITTPSLLPMLLQFDGEGRETAEYRKLTHWEA